MSPQTKPSFLTPDREAEKATDKAWSTPRPLIVARILDPFTAKRVVGDINTPPVDRNIRSFSDVVSPAAIDGINASVIDNLAGTAELDGIVKRVQNIGSTAIEVSEVEPTPERVEVHLSGSGHVA